MERGIRNNSNKEDKTSFCKTIMGKNYPNNGFQSTGYLTNEQLRKLARN